MSAAPSPPKQPFDPASAMRLLREAVRGMPTPSMFELRNRGYGSLVVVSREVVNTLSRSQATDAGVVSVVIVPMDPVLIG